MCDSPTNGSTSPPTNKVSINITDFLPPAPKGPPPGRGLPPLPIDTILEEEESEEGRLIRSESYVVINSTVEDKPTIPPTLPITRGRLYFFTILAGRSWELFVECPLTVGALKTEARTQNNSILSQWTIPQYVILDQPFVWFSQLLLCQPYPTSLLWYIRTNNWRGAFHLGDCGLLEFTLRPT